MKKLNPKDIDYYWFYDVEETGEYPTKWEEVTFFDEETDLAIVSVDERYGAVNSKGEVVIPLIYDYGMMSNISEGLLAFKKNNKWGYVNAHHNIIIPFEYDNIIDYKVNNEIWKNNNSIIGYAEGFQNGLVSVRKNGKMGIIDRQNKIVFDFIYKNINSFNKNYLTVSNDKLKYGMVDYNNNIVLPMVYDYLEIIDDILNFGETSDEDILLHHDDFVLCRIDNGKLIKRGILDFEGKVLVPAISSFEIKHYKDGKAMCLDDKKNEFFIYDSVTKETIYAPLDLKEKSENAGINFIRNLVGLPPVEYFYNE
ncbi:MAG: WG repeat-containing protein [Cloacibacterium caeni]